MKVPSDMDRVEEMAFAKVNLDLRVCGRRADGYHDLDSLVAFAGIGDHLTLKRADRLKLVIGGPFGSTLSSDQSNSVVVAARALAAMLGRDADVEVILDKRLPVASGLGGGSADAAATLRGLIRLWNQPMESADLMPLARSLGADVPVCLGSSAARMQGIGDRLSPISLAADLSVVLVNPGEAVATPDVFRALEDISGSRSAESLDETGLLAQRHLRESVNDLETPAIALAPIIETALDALRCQPGCRLARMSGSGATCFGLFGNATVRDRAVSTLAGSHPDWWVAGTVLR